MHSFHSYETAILCWRLELQRLPRPVAARYQAPGNHVVDKTTSHTHIHSTIFENIIIWSYPRIFTPCAVSRRLAYFPETLQGKRLGFLELGGLIATALPYFLLLASFCDIMPLHTSTESRPFGFCSLFQLS